MRSVRAAGSESEFARGIYDGLRAPQKTSEKLAADYTDDTDQH